HSGGSIEGEESMTLISYLFADPKFKAAAEKAGMRVYPSPSFRHIAVQSGAEIQGIKLIPPHDHLGEVIEPLLPTGCENAKILKELMELAHTVLNHHPINEARRAAGKLPANGVWFWAEGSAVVLDSFVERYHKTGTVISAVPLCHGIAKLSGLDVVLVEGATGELDTNYEGKVAAALNVLRSAQDFVAIHVEAPDECTHNGDLPGKLQAIEWLDSRVVGPLLSELDKDKIEYRVLILSDHKTLTATRGHDGEPVPYLLYDSRKDTKLGLAYTELNGEKGSAYSDGAGSVMPLLFEQTTK
ncbi:MAG: phosphoglycerate mutase, partial [Oscillospiraceae bacterium]